MKDLLNEIIQANQIVIERKIYISKNFFQFLYDREFNLSIEIVSYNELELIEIGAIPEDIRDDLGLYKSRIFLDQQENLNSEISCTNNSKNLLAEMDISNALINSKKYMHEFVDFFIDSNDIEQRSLTLSILMEMRKSKWEDKLYLNEVYKILKERKIQSCLVVESFEEFYSNLMWFKRIGFVNGLIRKDYNFNN